MKRLSKNLWHCGVDGHPNLEARDGDVEKGRRSCPYCRGRLSTLENSLATVFPHIAKDYSKTLNRLPVERVRYDYTKILHWEDHHGHKWRASITGVLSGRNSCPYCSEIKLDQGFNDLLSKYPEFIKSRWCYPENESLSLNPSDFTRSSRTKAWFKCPNCLHKSFKSICNAFSRQDLNSCRACNNWLLVPGVNDLATLHPDVLDYWNYELNHIDPKLVKASESVKVFFNCKSCLAPFSSSLRNYLRDSTTGLCSACLNNGRSLGEQELVDFLEDFLQLKVLQNFRKLLGGKEVDAYIPDLKIALEYNGEHWHSSEMMRMTVDEVKDYHLQKLQKAREAGVVLAFVWEDDWKNDRTELVKDVEMLLEFREVSKRLSRLISVRDLD